MAEDVAYCFNCKKFFDMNLTDGQGFICCPDCKGAYRFNIMQLSYTKEEKFHIEIQDELIFPFKNKKDFNEKVSIMRKLINRSNN